MKKMLWVITLIISFGCVGGYANVSDGEKWHFHGYIIEEKENQILVVDGVTKTDLSRKTVEEPLEKGSIVVWLSTKDIDETYSATRFMFGQRGI